MPSNEFKRAVRAYMAAHPGVSYAAAHRILTAAKQQAAADRVRAQVTVTASNTDPGWMQWKIQVDDPRTPDDGPHTVQWLRSNAGIQIDVDHMAAVLGWERAPGAVWPAAPTTDPAEVELVRSAVGKRVDQVQAMYDATGLRYHRAHEPYIAAVAHELERCGVEVADWHANPDEPRDGAIELAVPIRPYEETHFAWREDLGWYDIRTKTSGTLGDITVDLPVGHLAVPFEVATAICQVLGHPVTVDKPDWQPPADYNPEAVEADAWWDASPDLERALTCYTTYPGWENAEPHR